MRICTLTLFCIFEEVYCTYATDTHRIWTYGMLVYCVNIASLGNGRRKSAFAQAHEPLGTSLAASDDLLEREI